MKKQKIELRVSDTEKLIIKAVANNKGIAMSEYIMNLVYADLKKTGMF